MPSAGPFAAVTTRPETTKAPDGGSTSTRAGAPAFAAGMIVTETKLPFSDSAAEGAREGVESVFCS